jgi:hypothetical protein
MRNFRRPSICKRRPVHYLGTCKLNVTLLEWQMRTTVTATWPVTTRSLKKYGIRVMTAPQHRRWRRSGLDLEIRQRTMNKGTVLSSSKRQTSRVRWKTLLRDLPKRPTEPRKKLQPWKQSTKTSRWKHLTLKSIKRRKRAAVRRLEVNSPLPKLDDRDSGRCLSDVIVN